MSLSKREKKQVTIALALFGLFIIYVFAWLRSPVIVIAVHNNSHQRLRFEWTNYHDKAEPLPLRPGLFPQVVRKFEQWKPASGERGRRIGSCSLLQHLRRRLFEWRLDRAKK